MHIKKQKARFKRASSLLIAITLATSFAAQAESVDNNVLRAISLANTPDTFGAGIKNLSRRKIDKETKIRLALDKAANDGRMFAVEIDEVDILTYLNDDELTRLFIRNLKKEKFLSGNTDAIELKLSQQLKDPVLIHNIIEGYEKITLSVKKHLPAFDKSVMIYVIVGNENVSETIFKDIQNKLVVYLNKESSNISIYCGYNLIRWDLYKQESKIDEFISRTAKKLTDIAYEDGKKRLIFNFVKNRELTVSINAGKHEGDDDTPDGSMSTHTSGFFDEVNDIAEELRNFGIQCDVEILGEGLDQSLTRHFVSIDEDALLKVPLEKVDFVENYLISRCIEILKGERAGSLYSAMDILKKLGSKSKNATMPLVELLKKGDFEYFVVGTLKSIGPSAKDAVFMLDELLEESENVHRILSVLENIGAEAEYALPAINKLINTTDNSDVRESAANVIIKIEEALNKLRAYKLKVGEPVRHLRSGKKYQAEFSNIELFLARNIADLGVRHRQFPLGGKDKGFVYFKELGLLYPSGIVLSSNLLKHICEKDKIPDIYIQYILNRLRKASRYRLYRKPKSVSVRSSPIVSMPGRLKTVTEVTDEKQIIEAVKEVAESWYSKEAKEFRKLNSIPDDFNMNLIIQLMEPQSVTKGTISGVFTTHDPDSGEDTVCGRYIKGARGDELMTKGNPGNDICDLKHYKLLKDCGKRLESKLRYPQEVEFVLLGRGDYLVCLQTRPMRFSPHGELLFLQEQLRKGKIKDFQLIPRLERLQKSLKGRTLFKVQPGYKGKYFLRGLFSTPGATQGIVIFNPDPANLGKFAAGDAPIIFVATEENREAVIDVIFEYQRVGLITTYGNNSSHEAVLCRMAGIPCIINAEGVVALKGQLMREGETILREGNMVVLDGDNNLVLSSERDALEVNTLMEDASFGINIAAFREDFMKPCLTEKGTVKEEIFYDSLLGLNKQKMLEYTGAKKSGDTKRAFIANLEKHLLHELIFKKGTQIGKNKTQVNRDINASSTTNLNDDNARAEDALQNLHTQVLAISIAA